MTTSAIMSFTGEHRFLSNFYEEPVRIGSIEYQTAEHAYQSAKCFYESDACAVRSAYTPGAAKRLGQHVQLVPGWEESKRRVMLKVVTAKFLSNPELASRLLQTGDAELIEGNTWGDAYWGVCDGRGANYLGRILMVTRDAVRLLSE